MTPYLSKFQKHSIFIVAKYLAKSLKLVSTVLIYFWNGSQLPVLSRDVEYFSYHRMVSLAVNILRFRPAPISVAKLPFLWYDNFGENRTPLHGNGMAAIPKTSIH